MRPPTAAGVHDSMINMMVFCVIMPLVFCVIVPMVCTTSGIVSAIFCGIDTLQGK